MNKIAFVIMFFLLLSCLSFAQQKPLNDSLVTISNQDLSVKINLMGAELKSLHSKKTNMEYLWEGNPEFYSRSAPILFPFIGRLWQGGYNLDGKRYSMGIHGFAKDCNFEVIRKSNTDAWFKLKSNDETLKIYPFSFELTIGYVLTNNRLKVIWDVLNTGHEEMYFQIGGHPGFNYPDFDENDENHAYLEFEQTGKKLSYIVKDSTGFLNRSPVCNKVKLDESGKWPISQKLFRTDAMIFEGYQARKVTMYGKNRKKHLSVEFDTPLFTLWSTPDKKAPFICIEPLWGRIDEYETTRDMRERVWTLNISPGERFITSYEIEIF